MVGVTQLAAYNRSKSFSGGAQLGFYNRNDASFRGLAQVGVFDHARGDFTGLLQLGVVSATGEDLFADSGNDKHRFAGLAQVSVVATNSNNFYGPAQIGVASYTAGTFGGIVQIGGLAAGAKRFRGLAQIGAGVVSKDSYGMQIGVAALAFEEHTGRQLGAAGNYTKSINGAQVGLVNLAGPFTACRLASSTTRETYAGFKSASPTTPKTAFFRGRRCSTSVLATAMAAAFLRATTVKTASPKGPGACLARSDLVLRKLSPDDLQA